jgi:lysine 2,3-aminomutase
VQGGGKVPLQPNYVLSMNGDELMLKNYEGQVYRYRNPGQQNNHERIMAAPVSGAVPSLLADAARPLETEGETDANRVVVRS